MGFIKTLFMGTISYAFYIELSPGLGNIWYRTGVDGCKHIRLDNLWSLMINPLISRDLWTPSLWDTNYFIFMAIWFVVYRCGRKILIA